MFKLKTVIFAALLSALSLTASGEIKYYPADNLPVYGKSVQETWKHYTRLPGYLEGKVRKSVWGLGQDSAGLSVRFRSDASEIWASYVLFGNTHMNHMADTGSKGVDLYAFEDGKWVFVKTGRPANSKHQNVKIISNMETRMREYILYLPLYDGLDSLSIGVNEGAQLLPPAMDFPSREKPVVMYGTSILQGGCASRTGMAFTNIISRKTGREVVNLGFSGNAKLDYKVAELMASIPDPGVFVMDNLYNCSKEIIRDSTATFVKILRDAHPDVPILMLGHVPYAHSYYDTVSRNNQRIARVEAQKLEFSKLKAAGYRNIFYYDCATTLGTDREGSVDGTHFTDLGMMRYSEWILPILEKHMLKPGPARTTDCSLFWKNEKYRQVREISYDGISGYRQVGHHGPAVENSHMAARIYMNGKGGIDIYSKTGKRSPELRQYKWYPDAAQRTGENAGCDEYYVGRTVGLGGIWLWDGEKAVLPVPTGKMLARDGKTKDGAWMEVIAYGVEYKGGKVDISIRVDVTEGSRRAKVTATELNGRKVQFLTGVNYPSGAKTYIGKNCLAAWGVHPADVSSEPCEIGGGMWFKPSAFCKPEDTGTQLQIISRPAAGITTEIISASIKEEDLGSAEKFLAIFHK